MDIIFEKDNISAMADFINNGDNSVYKDSFAKQAALYAMLQNEFDIVDDVVFIKASKIEIEAIYHDVFMGLPHDIGGDRLKQVVDNYNPSASQIKAFSIGIVSEGQANSEVESRLSILFSNLSNDEEIEVSTDIATMTSALCSDYEENYDNEKPLLEVS